MINKKDMYTLKRVSIEGRDDNIGIIIKDSDNYLGFKLITINGTEMLFDFSELLKVSIVRGIDKDIRDIMNSYGKEENTRYKKLEKLRIEVEKLEKDVEREDRKIKELIVKERGLLADSVFKSMVVKGIEKLTPRGHQAAVFVSHIYKTININMYKDIQKYASPDEFSFLYLEYDRTLHMRHNSKSYEELKKRYEREVSLKSKELIKEIEKKYSCEIEIDSYLSIGDKDWLTYNYETSIKMTNEINLTKEEVEKILELVSTILK